MCLERGRECRFDSEVRLTSRGSNLYILRTFPSFDPEIRLFFFHFHPVIIISSSLCFHSLAKKEQANVFFSLCAGNWPPSLGLSLSPPLCLPPPGWRGSQRRQGLLFVEFSASVTHTCSTRAATGLPLCTIEISSIQEETSPSGPEWDALRPPSASHRAHSHLQLVAFVT